ncbi:MAG: NADH-quinone oxidoreductase subunit L, partial [Planctomycetes bacterium]|nr:NADH-quinone oxidoreductase subunit L [Planctomycetota bacterium]
MRSLMEYAWLIPLLPLLAFPTIIFLGKRLPGKGSSVSILAIVLSFILSCFILGGMMKAPETVHRANIGWLSLGPLEFRMGILVDGLTAVMLFVVTLVSMLVQIYSLGYMHGDPRFSRFYAYLSLFTFAMLGLVVADNFMLLFICWELVGVCSYFLIGFWFEKKSASDAGKKAFITTKIGDIAFFIGILTLFSVFKTFSFEQIAEGVAAGNISAGLLTAAAVLVFGGAVGKSAQFPLHVWLPDAMEGPTPVSALIHAATMVAAGVYLVARAYGIFAPSPDALHVVAYIGIITAFIAATIAVVNNDIKRVLAYSTVSQLGYMMMALGVGGYTAGMF